MSKLYGCVLPIVLLALSGCALGVEVGERALLQRLQQDVQQLQAQVSQLTDDNAALRTLLADPVTRNVSTIGFTAVKTSEQNATQDELIAWDVILSNYGDGFSLLTDTFVCPKAGVYFFAVNLYNNGGANGRGCSGTLVLDGANQVRAQGRVTGPDAVAMTVSNSALIGCAAGQRVSIQSDQNNNFVGSDSGRTSSFSGYLVYEGDF